MSENARRLYWNIVFGEGPDRWQFPDPGAERAGEANWQARHGGDEGRIKGALILAEIASALHYLIHTCPTTKLACEKLAAVRRAVRELPEEPAGAAAPPLAVEPGEKP